MILEIKRRARAHTEFRESTDIPVFSSSFALFKWWIMCVMDLIVPFLGFRVSRASRTEK